MHQKAINLGIIKLYINQNQDSRRAPLKSHLNTSPITFLAGTLCQTSCDLGGRPGVAWRNIQGRVAVKEVPWSEQQRHRFCRHNGEVLRGREVGDSEGMPEDNIGVFDGAVGTSLLDPSWQALRGLPRGLWNVTASGIDLVIRI